MAKRLLVFIFGVTVYLLFLFTVLYGIGFVGNIAVPKSVDSGAPSPLATTILINLLLVAIFWHSTQCNGTTRFQKAMASFHPGTRRTKYLCVVYQPVTLIAFLAMASASDNCLEFSKWRDEYCAHQPILDWLAVRCRIYISDQSL